MLLALGRHVSRTVRIVSSTSSLRLDPATLDELHGRVRREVDDGHISAAQLAIAVDGAVREFHAYGTATTEHRFCIFSATKTLTATALLPHLADGSVDLTTPVARYVPAFGENGKGEVTVLQLLTMQGGFPQAVMSRKLWGTREGRQQQLAEWTLAYRAGTHTEYHPLSAHWVIAELIEQMSGRSYVDQVHDLVTGPAGAAPVLGEAALQRGTPTTIRALDVPASEASLLATYGRRDLMPVAVLEVSGFLAMNDPRSWTAAIPGGGGISTAHDMALVYQHMIHNFSGALPSAWLADAVGTIRNTSVSLSDKVAAQRTLTGYVSSNDGYHDNRWMPSAPRAFGHAGAGGQLCWVDPDSGLSFSFLHDTVNADPTVEYRRNADLHRLLMAAMRR